jgi:hypothetical protein
MKKIFLAFLFLSPLAQAKNLDTMDTLNSEEFPDRYPYIEKVGNITWLADYEIANKLFTIRKREAGKPESIYHYRLEKLPPHILEGGVYFIGTKDPAFLLVLNSGGPEDILLAFDPVQNEKKPVATWTIETDRFKVDLDQEDFQIQYNDRSGLHKIKCDLRAAWKHCSPTPKK